MGISGVHPTEPGSGLFGPGVWAPAGLALTCPVPLGHEVRQEGILDTASKMLISSKCAP